MADNRETTLVLEREWEQIRNKFTEDQKTELRDAVIGQVICPKGNYLNLDVLSIGTRKILEGALKPLRNKKTV